MLRKLALLLLLALSPSLFAATADVSIVSFTVSTLPTQTGERFAVVMRWRNNGPDTATVVNAIVSGTPGPFFILGVGTSGWPCYTTAGARSFTCQGVSLAPGAEAEMGLNVIAPANTTNGEFVLRGEVRAAETDPNLANNSQTITATLANSATSSDLSLSPTTQTQRAEHGELLTVPFAVANNGTADARNLVAVLTLPVTNNVPSFMAEGTGWSCGHGAFGPQLVICTRDRLRAGEVMPLTVRLTAPSADGSFDLTGHVRAEGLHEAAIANNTSVASIHVGDEPPPVQTFARVLVPLTADDVPGSNNALWRTETTVLIASDTYVDIRPHRCAELDPTLCVDPAVPQNRPFNARQIGVYGYGDWPNGQFFYVRTEDASKLRLNSRVYDVARLQETAGAEIPIAREHDFVSRPISLLGIPVAPQFRHTLRVYGFDAQPERVQISVYANAETTPRVSQTHTLMVPEAMRRFSPGLWYPSHPSYLQFQLDQLLALGGVSTLRIEVAPLDGGRIWSFVSVTNNETHHVTTFSAQ